jgi:hypothetical protein
MASAAFNSPAILFLNTWDGPERDYMGTVLSRLYQQGYKRLIDPCAAAYTMATVAVEAGWPAEAIRASDVFLFPSVLGSVFAGQPLEALGITLDGIPMELTGDPCEQAAQIMYWQLRCRMEAKPDRNYWGEMVQDLVGRQDAHLSMMESQVRRLYAKLHGLEFQPRNLWASVEEAIDDPEAVIVINPPTYKGAYEKFFDTDGRMSWTAPTYDVWDSDVDIYRVADQLQGRKALLLIQQQQLPGAAAKSPVFARMMSHGDRTYICTNRPEEVLPLTNGFCVVPLTELPLTKLDVPVIPPDHLVTADSTVSVMALSHAEASYYRDLWMHKLDYKQTGYYVAVVIDGFLAGIGGYDTSTIVRPYQNKWLDALLLTFGVSPAHPQRLNRLMTHLMCSRPIIRSMMLPHVNAVVKRLITVEFTRYPESKGMRGLMKLESRTSDPKYGYKLVYVTDVKEVSTKDCVKTWLAKEAHWAKGRVVDAS